MSTNLITDDEAAIYDRQIRLWGMNAQLQLRKARILVIGVDGLCTEVCKNICLAGVSSIHIWDDKNIDKIDVAGSFILRTEHLGQNVCL